MNPEFESRPIEYKVSCTTHGDIGSTLHVTDAMNLFLAHMVDIRDNHPDQQICENYNVKPVFAGETTADES